MVAFIFLLVLFLISLIKIVRLRLRVDTLELHAKETCVRLIVAEHKAEIAYEWIMEERKRREGVIEAMRRN